MSYSLEDYEDYSTLEVDVEEDLKFKGFGTNSYPGGYYYSYSPTEQPVESPTGKPTEAPTESPTFAPAQLVIDEFSFLKELYDGTNGPFWENNENWNFTSPSARTSVCEGSWFGIVPSVMGSDCYVWFLQLGSNNLTGTVPRAFNLTQLGQLDLSNNQISGKLPIVRGGSYLFFVSFANNAFTGTIPQNMLLPAAWNTLGNFEIRNNELHGEIPEFMYRLKAINTLNVAYNMLSGTIPTASLAKMKSKLTTIALDQNNFHGPFPNITMFTRLTTLTADNNHFTGSIPVLPARVRTFSAISNHFEGEIGRLGRLRNLNYFHISSNYFSGSVPHALCRSAVLSLILADNHFSGELPDCIGGLSNLMSIQVAYNYFHGNLGAIFNSSSIQQLPILGYVSLGYNQFSGEIPPILFQLPSIRGVSAPKNCFTGTISPEVCNNVTSDVLMLIDLDGMHASYQCHSSLPDFMKMTGRIMKGSVPSCIFARPMLEIITLSGNGFTGTIPYNLSLSPHLLAVNLSNNYFSGSFPLSPILEHSKLQSFDISYNKFFDLIEQDNSTISYNYSYFNHHSFLKMKRNRLSGNFPSSLTDFDSINALEGNVFDCSSSKSFPEHDPDIHHYFCGSSSINYSSFGFLLAIGLFICTFLVYIIFKINAKNHSAPLFSRPNEVQKKPQYEKEKEQEQTSHFTSFHQMFMISFSSILFKEEKATSRYENIQHLWKLLSFFVNLSLLVLSFCIVILLPIYLGFHYADGDAYNTYEHIASWSATSVFLKGNNPAILLCIVLLVMDVIIISIVYYYLPYTKTWIDEIFIFFRKKFGYDYVQIQHPTHEEDHSHPETNQNNQLNQITSFEYFWIVGFSLSIFLILFLFFSITIVISVAMNIFYIQIASNTIRTSRNANKIVIQLGIALYNIFWCQGILVFCSRYWKYISFNSHQNENGDDSSKYFTPLFPQRLNNHNNNNHHQDTNKATRYEKKDYYSFIFHYYFFIILIFNNIIGPLIATLFMEKNCFNDFFWGTDEKIVNIGQDDCDWFYQNDDYEICYHQSTFSLPFLYYYNCMNQIFIYYFPVFIYQYAFMFLFAFIYSILMMNIPIGNYFSSLLFLGEGIFRPEDYEIYERKHRLQAAVINKNDGQTNKNNQDLSNVVGSQQESESPAITPMNIELMTFLHTNEIIASFFFDFCLLLSFGMHSAVLSIFIVAYIVYRAVLWKFCVYRYLAWTKDKNDHKKSSPSTVAWRPGDEIDDFYLTGSLHNQNPLGAAGIDGIHSEVDDDDNMSHNAPYRANSEASHMESCIGVKEIDGDSIDPRLTSQERKQKKKMMKWLNDSLVDDLMTYFTLKSSSSDSSSAMASASSNLIWGLFYCSCFIATFRLFDMVGEVHGFHVAIWVPTVIMPLMVVLRLFYVDLFRFILRCCCACGQADSSVERNRSAASSFDAVGGQDQDLPNETVEINFNETA